ncbi:PilZ domain-containing protein [Alteraurantiacibacter palmitatis]|uniref:PilZ domain-containing protein n=1 Tax=Alteraurantiacibacter palmitatis TaxID=2054628 RepID=A0ABV7E7Q4_9SPHN
MARKPAVPIGRRRDARLRLGVPAQLITLAGQYTVCLADLSQSGAHVAARQPFEVSRDAVLSWMGFEAFGRVVWHRGSEAGIEFDELLPEAVLLQTRQQVDSGKVRSFEEELYEGARSWYLNYRNT